MVKDITETTNLVHKLKESEPTTRETTWTYLGPLYICDTCVTWATCGTTNTDSRGWLVKPIPLISLPCQASVQREVISLISP